ncbi:MAG: hypothetical protein PHS57_09060 [Alphaproteobacteria bacterium]|nr:hypothetical protein [Alphaproteobacteria bacterium]
MSNPGTEIALPGSVEIAAVNPNELPESFFDAVDECVLNVNRQANAQQAANEEERKKAVENEERKWKKAQARAENYERISSVLSKVTSPFLTPVAKGVDVGTAYVGKKYNAYKAAKRAKIKSENKERLLMLFNAVQPIIFKTKGMSAIEDKSNFELFVVNTSVGNINIHKGNCLHYVAAEKLENPSNKNPNVVVLSILDNGHIKIHGNYRAYEKKMGKSPVKIHIVSSSYSDCMPSMYWSDRARVIHFCDQQYENKDSSLEAYRRFNKRAVSRITGHVKENVVNEARDTFIRMIAEQNLYARNGQALTVLDI